MKIGEHDINNTDLLKINIILSNFFNFTCNVIDGIAAGIGRSVNEDKQYRLNINNDLYASVKLRYDNVSYHQIELLVHDVREILGLANYDVKRIPGFPMNGEKWRQGDCLLIDWGIQNNRIDLVTLEPTQLSAEDTRILFEGIATNAALAYCLGLWDRNNRNFVWDKTDKKLISIDHESFIKENYNNTIPSEISSVLTKFFGDNWYDDDEQKNDFTNIFSLMWYEIAKKQEAITEIFEKYEQSSAISVLDRIKKGPAIPLGLIMM